MPSRDFCRACSSVLAWVTWARRARSGGGAAEGIRTVTQEGGQAGYPPACVGEPKHLYPVPFPETQARRMAARSSAVRVICRGAGRGLLAYMTGWGLPSPYTTVSILSWAKSLVGFRQRIFPHPSTCRGHLRTRRDRNPGIIAAILLVAPDGFLHPVGQQAAIGPV